jgi:hypothetical protein
MTSSQTPFSGPSKAPMHKTPTAPVVSAARSSAIPKAEPQTRQTPHDMIAKRAYEIFMSGKGGSQIDNWLRAERELRAGK